MEPGDGEHAGDARNAAPLVRHQPSLRPVQQELGCGQLPGPELVLHLYNLNNWFYLSGGVLAVGF